MESIFGPMPTNPVNIEYSLFIGNWPRFDFNSMLILLLIPPLSRVSCLELMKSLRAF